MHLIIDFLLRKKITACENLLRFDILNQTIDRVPLVFLRFCDIEHFLLTS